MGNSISHGIIQNIFFDAYKRYSLMHAGSQIALSGHRAAEKPVSVWKLKFSAIWHMWKIFCAGCACVKWANSF